MMHHILYHISKIILSKPWTKQRKVTDNPLVGIYVNKNEKKITLEIIRDIIWNF